MLLFPPDTPSLHTVVGLLQQAIILSLISYLYIPDT